MTLYATGIAYQFIQFMTSSTIDQSGVSIKNVDIIFEKNKGSLIVNQKLIKYATGSKIY